MAQRTFTAIEEAVYDSWNKEQPLCFASTPTKALFIAKVLSHFYEPTNEQAEQPEPEQPTPAAEVIIELSKRVSALEEWKERHNLHPFERHQPRDTTNVTPIPEFDAGL